MPTNLNKVVTSNTINAADLKSNDEKVQRWLNGGMVSRDLDSDEWVKTNHIRPPNFYGAPAPRTELVSSDVHYRQRHSEIESEFTSWKDVSLQNTIPVEGMAITLHATPKDPGRYPVAHIYANCYAREFSFGEGSDWDRVSSSSQHTQPNYNKYNFAVFYMYVQAEDEEPYTVPHTGRRIYAGNADVGRTRPSSPQNLCWQAKVRLQHGINHVYIGVYIQHASGTQGKRLLISNRNFIADVHYI